MAIQSEFRDLRGGSGRGPQKRRPVPNAYRAFNEFYWELKIVETRLSQHDFFDLVYCAEVLDDAEACLFLAKEFDHWWINIRTQRSDGEGKIKEEMAKWRDFARACRPFAEYLYRKAVYKGCDEAASPLAFFCQEHHRADERIWWQHAANRCQDADAMRELAAWHLRPPNKDIDRAINWFQRALQIDGPSVDILDYVDTLKKRGKPEDIREAIAVLAMLVDPESSLSNDLTDSSEMSTWISQKKVEREIASVIPKSYVGAELFSEKWFTFEEEGDDYLYALFVALAEEYAADDSPNRDLQKAAFWALQSLCLDSQILDGVDSMGDIVRELNFRDPESYSTVFEHWGTFSSMDGAEDTDFNDDTSYKAWRSAFDALWISLGSALAEEFLARGERHLAKNLNLDVVFLPEGSDHNPKQTEAITVLANEFFAEDDDALNRLFEKSEELDDPVYECIDLPDIRKKQQQEAGWSPDRPWGNRLKKLVEGAEVSDKSKTQSVINVMRIDHGSHVKTD